MAFPRVGDRLGFDEVTGELAIHPMGPFVAVTEATLDNDDILAFTSPYIPLGTSLAQICAVPDTSTTAEGPTVDPSTQCLVEVYPINFVEVDFNDSGSAQTKDLTVTEIFDRRFFAAANTLADYQPGDIVAVIAANNKFFIVGLVSVCPNGLCPADATTEEPPTTPGDPTQPPTTQPPTTQPPTTQPPTTQPPTTELLCEGNIGFSCLDVPVASIADIEFLLGLDANCCMFRVPFTECPVDPTTTTTQAP